MYFNQLRMNISMELMKNAFRRYRRIVMEKVALPRFGTIREKRITQRDGQDPTLNKRSLEIPRTNTSHLGTFSQRLNTRRDGGEIPRMKT
jgi:hypothetical protein